MKQSGVNGLNSIENKIKMVNSSFLHREGTSAEIWLDLETINFTGLSYTNKKDKFKQN